MNDTLDYCIENTRNLTGNFIELGVYKGDSAKEIYERMPRGKILFLLDTFTGHPCHAECDSEEHPIGRYADVDLGEVVGRLNHPNVVIISGDIRETMKTLDCEEFAFAHVDVDQYESTKAAIEFLLPRMTEGGIIRFDDYGYVSGATKAVDELIGKHNLLNDRLMIV